MSLSVSFAHEVSADSCSCGLVISEEEIIDSAPSWYFILERILYDDIGLEFLMYFLTLIAVCYAFDGKISFASCLLHCLNCRS